jgi:hypothetical protein
MSMSLYTPAEIKTRNYTKKLLKFINVTEKIGNDYSNQAQKLYRNTCTRL